MTVSPSSNSQFVSLESALKHYFGYDSFRPGQRQIIEKALQNQDLLVVMPTGGGKSLCYQLPALLKPGLTIVVSPLIALMQDQVQALGDNGIPATFLNSSLNGTELRERERAILDGEIKLVYIAPERLLNEGRLAGWLSQVYVAAIAIDEAHCVSEWGHDFRPEYRQLNQLRQWFANVPIMALTATATERVRYDIIEQLNLQDPVLHVSTFNRPNLYYDVRPKHKQTYRELLQLIRQHEGASGIIYCLSRKRVDELTTRLQQDGISVLPYHAGMDNKRRAENQSRFIRDDVQVMVATIAFGMGINKPDVRFVVHYDLPRNIEGYYQESGRAGRDGEPARCTLFFSMGDVKTVEFLISQKVDPNTGDPLEDEQRIATQQLRRVLNYAEATECRRIIQLGYFGETFPGNCGNCDNCLQPKPVEDWTIEAQKFLSCVARVRERFGMNYVIDVLRGSRNQRLLQNGHDKLSTYGIGKDRSADEWRMLGRSLIHQGLVEETSDGYSVLRLNHQSWEVLRKQRSVAIAVPPKPLADTPHPSTRSDTATVEELFQRLQKLRKRIADEQSVPPYVVFQNTSLRDMAERQPLNNTDFAAISGVGSRKLSQYGEVFLAEIRVFRAEKGLLLESGSPKALALPASAIYELNSLAPTETHLVTFKLYQQGLKPFEIAEQRNLRLSTVTNHLAELIELGYEIPLENLVLAARQKKIVEAIEAVGVESRRRIRDYLGEVFGYDEINLVVAWWRRNNQ
uniref:DNA helicase RecQ n=1 Tax=Oscillatoriales cyanobacterium SpSt-402 TaxID=2282168 RepID=A0A832H5R7_9CYAN